MEDKLQGMGNEPLPVIVGRGAGGREQGKNSAPTINGLEALS
jgi:hypothetical protein